MEICVSVAIFSIGFLIFTLLTKVAVAIIFDGFTIDRLKRKKTETAVAES
jgi:hypothetical protein